MALYDSTAVFLKDDGLPLTEEHKKSLRAAIRKAVDSHFPSLAIKAGSKAPSFALPNTQGMPLNSLDLIRKGSLILVFFRGLWCWYSYTKLLKLEVIVEQIRNRGANIVAVSPQIEFSEQDSERRKHVSFPILCDRNNRLAAEYGISYPVSGPIKKLYGNVGIDLTNINGCENDALPLASQFIIDRHGVIVFAEINADYTDTARVDELLLVLDSMPTARTSRS